jgi:hypothetical protein
MSAPWEADDPLLDEDEDQQDASDVGADDRTLRTSP